MADWIQPDWPAPARVRALQTLRSGGVSVAPYTSLNLGDHVGDAPGAVVANRALLRQQLPAEPCWLMQVHGTTVVEAEHIGGQAPDADAVVAHTPGLVCAVMTADCLPVLLCDQAGRVVAAAHAGWRGLCAGIIEQTVRRMGVEAGQLLAWLGPAIGPQAFEVGDEVRAAFLADAPEAVAAFQPGAVVGKWLADLYALARLRLARCGVQQIYGGEYCTYSDPDRFFSYRRDQRTGRQASLIWLSSV